MTNKEIAIHIAKTLDEKKAQNISILDISERSGFADYFVTTTASSLRQMNSLTDELDDRMAQEGLLSRNIEGKGESGWILIDYGDIIVNIFTEEARNKYQIEKIWGDCTSIDFNEA